MAATAVHRKPGMIMCELQARPALNQEPALGSTVILRRGSGNLPKVQSRIGPTRGWCKTADLYRSLQHNPALLNPALSLS